MRFSAVRQVGLFFGAAYSTAECSWQACGISARHCLASTFGGHTRSSQSYFFFWAIAEALFQTCVHGRMQSCLRTLLVCFYQSVSHNRFGSCYHTFFRCKVSMQPGTAKSLGQWRSLTNLPLSSLWFWRLALTKIKSICLLSLLQPYTALTYVDSVKIILITT